MNKKYEEECVDDGSSSEDECFGMDEDTAYNHPDERCIWMSQQGASAGSKSKRGRNKNQSLCAIMHEKNSSYFKKYMDYTFQVNDRSDIEKFLIVYQVPRVLKPEGAKGIRTMDFSNKKAIVKNVGRYVGFQRGACIYGGCNLNVSHHFSTCKTGLKQLDTDLNGTGHKKVKVEELLNHKNHHRTINDPLGAFAIYTNLDYCLPGGVPVLQKGRELVRKASQYLGYLIDMAVPDPERSVLAVHGGFNGEKCHGKIKLPEGTFPAILDNTTQIGEEQPELAKIIGEIMVLCSSQLSKLVMEHDLKECRDDGEKSNVHPLFRKPAVQHSKLLKILAKKLCLPEALADQLWASGFTVVIHLVKNGHMTPVNWHVDGPNGIGIGKNYLVQLGDIIFVKDLPLNIQSLLSDLEHTWTAIYLSFLVYGRSALDAPCDRIDYPTPDLYGLKEGDENLQQEVDALEEAAWKSLKEH